MASRCCSIPGHLKSTVEDYYELLVPEPRIAVLSSAQVASSGEATLIALKGLDNSRVFGSDSCGLSTANSSFSVSDGAQLFLCHIHHG